MKSYPKAKGRASTLSLAFRKLHPTCESLERRELLASIITFNPTGTPATQPISVGSFDFAPGNSLSVNSLPLAVGKTIQLDYQAVLADVIDSQGQTVIPPGLNTTYQITAVASFTEVVTDASPTAVKFALAPTQSPNSFFELYYNPAVVANNLAGTGFNVGTLILAGKPDPSLTNSGNFVLATDASGNPVILPFDLFDTNNYPGIQSVTGVGSAQVSADVSSFDPAFFITPVIQLSFNTSTTTPFRATDPSALFVGLPGGVPPNVTPNIGTINGVNGTDFQFSSDANNSFIAAPTTITTTPDPTTVTLSNAAPPPLNDTAVLSGGSSPTGTITFTLTYNGAVVYTDHVTVNGDGTYSTAQGDNPGGYTLPNTGTVMGTYQWAASYSGDSNNPPAQDQGGTSEQVTVSPASPSITTTPDPTSATLGTTTVILKDSAVLSGGYFPTGTITFTLVAPGARPWTPRR